MYPKAEEAEQVFRMIREDIPLDGKASKRKTPVAKDQAAPAAEIAVSVRNATATDTLGPAQGRASTVKDLLTDAGFAKATVDSQNVERGRQDRRPVPQRGPGGRRAGGRQGARDPACRR